MKKYENCIKQISKYLKYQISQNISYFIKNLFKKSREKKVCNTNILLV